MKHYCDEWIHEWCSENGWTDVVFEHSTYWAFPPGAVIPEPIPPKVLRVIKTEKGLSTWERLGSISAVTVTLMAGVASYILHCPMPLVFAFAFGAVTVAHLEDEDS